MFEVKEKPRLVEKAYLLAVILREEERANAESLLDELEELVSNLGIRIFCKKTRFLYSISKFLNNSWLIINKLPS